MAEGSLLGGYAFTAYKSRPPDTQAPARSSVLTDAARTKAAEAARATAQVVAAAIHLTRDLVNTPPGDLTPAASPTPSSPRPQGARRSR